MERGRRGGAPADGRHLPRLRSVPGRQDHRGGGSVSAVLLLQPSRSLSLTSFLSVVLAALRGAGEQRAKQRAAPAAGHPTTARRYLFPRSGERCHGPRARH